MNTRKVATEYRLTQWAQVIQERIAGGESITAFCENRGISKNTYFYWQRRIREATCEHLVLSQGSADNGGFAEVKLARSQASALSGQIRIEYNGIALTFDSAYPTEKLAALLRELV